MSESKNKDKKNLIIFDGDKTHVEIWEDLFIKEIKTNLRVIVVSWIDTEITSYPDICLLTCNPIYDSAAANSSSSISTVYNSLTIKPDFVLIRNLPRGPNVKTDKRNVFFGLMHGNIPSLNTLESEYMQFERAIMFAGLKKVAKEKKNFPLVQQTYYSSHLSMIISPDLPAVMKISYVHAGKGKTKVDNMQQFHDLTNIVCLHDDYVTGEPYINAKYSIRIQKIGKHYRAYLKEFTGSNWTTHSAGSILTNTEIKPEYIEWVEAAATEFKLDICALDILYDQSDKPWIIELNSTAIGIAPDFFEEDSRHIRDLVLEKMKL